MSDRVELDGGRIVLLRGDCLSILPTLAPGSVDYTITDPPYGINGGRGSTSKAKGKGNYVADFPDTPEYIETVVVPVIKQCITISKAVAVTTGNRCMFSYPRPTDIGCFYCPATTGIGPFGWTLFCGILFYGAYWRAGRKPLPTGMVLTEPPEKNGHPCPKPIKAWTWLVDNIAAPSSVVLDPFMGSGTTGIACIRTGRRFIGIELDQGYFDSACKRIEAELELRDATGPLLAQRKEPILAFGATGHAAKPSSVNSKIVGPPGLAVNGGVL